jgi:putative DNA primase/helicase
MDASGCARTASERLVMDNASHDADHPLVGQTEAEIQEARWQAERRAARLGWSPKKADGVTGVPGDKTGPTGPARTVTGPCRRKATSSSRRAISGTRVSNMNTANASNRSDEAQKMQTELEMEAGRKASQRFAVQRGSSPQNISGATANSSPFVQGATGGTVTYPGNVAVPVTDAKPNAPAPPKFLRPKFERMPAELKQRPNWLLWIPIWNGSKYTKRPIQPSGYGASTTNPKHWSSFDAVKQAYERAEKCGYIELQAKDKPSQRVSIGGVGFVFDGQPDKDGLVFAGVDFDSGAFKDEIGSLSAERVKRLGSYIEWSVSGTGVHVIVKARPLASGIAHNGIEMYTSGRYFTMTGHVLQNAQIVDNADEFAALAEELRVQSTNSDADKSNTPTEGGEQPETDTWFSKLQPEEQTEVVKYAALHVANNSKHFELTSNGGNYEQRYFKLALAIARSRVPDAENIFVEAASIAKGADPEEKLRKFFQDCEHATPRADGITAGTLFHIASQCGANFTKWKEIAGDRDPDVAMFVPGNEEDCRKKLARIVAADPLTYTLGDRAGPLVILRIPEAKALPQQTRWEGDLPGTTLAATADIMERAERLIWMKKGQWGPYRIRPPRDFISDYLTQLRGRYEARPLRSIVRVPYIDDTGQIHFTSGYDPQTGLFHDKSPTFPVLPKPSRDDAREAAEVLLDPFSQYQFEDPVAGRALVLAAIFTAIERPFLPVAPMFVIRSSMPGTGKGLIVRALVRLAFDTAPVFITWGGSSEEFEKRLSALLLQTPAVLSIDNANGMQIKGDLLESIITEGCADIRPLGYSKIVKVRNRSFISLTGNNAIITGDMARRSLSIDILPRSADPERDRYPFNPVERIAKGRKAALTVAFMAMQAFRLAGMPPQGLPAAGSFDDWSRRVRDLVYWITGYDVGEGFRRNKAEDPRRQGDASLLAALHQHFGLKPFKGAEVIAVHERLARPYASGTPTEQALHEALEDVLGSRGVNAKVFGYWARRVKGARIGGFILDTHHNPATNANDITVQRT